MEQNLSTLKNEDFWKQAEFNRYGIMAFVLIFQCCFASISICYILGLPEHLQLLPLILVSTSTMASNAVNIVLAPMKVVAVFFFTCVLISAITLIFSLVV